MPLPTDDSILLLHNPSCSTCRKTLALLEERGTRFVTRHYLEEPLTSDELRELCTRLGRPPIDFTRTKQAEFAAAGLSASSSDDEILQAMAAAPILMQRPIVVRGARAVISRPPEEAVDLLD